MKSFYVLIALLISSFTVQALELRYENGCPIDKVYNFVTSNLKEAKMVIKKYQVADVTAVGDELRVTVLYRNEEANSFYPAQTQFQEIYRFSSGYSPESCEFLGWWSIKPLSDKLVK